MRNVLANALLAVVATVAATPARAQGEKPRFTLNAHEYFEAPGVTVQVFDDVYPEGHQGGVSIIQHGERVATNCDVRLEPVPGQWAGLPKVGERTADPAAGRVRVSLEWADEELAYTVSVEGCGESICLGVDLDAPLPGALVGRASFNLELFPGAYFGKTYHLGGTSGVFPRQWNGPVRRVRPGAYDATQPPFEPVPLGRGPRLVVSSEDPRHRMTIEVLGDEAELLLLDGRANSQNGWFVVRSLVPAGSTRGAVRWRITPHAIPGWTRQPVIAVSQVGYHPAQVKRALVELEPGSKMGPATLLRVETEGEPRSVAVAPLRPWGHFLRYEYGVFDFTSVDEPGVYLIEYDGERTAPFRIAADVYRTGVWQPTLETYFPVQMCHVEVKDRYRTWHGPCHMDDALQATPGTVHFDSYRQGDETDTPFAPGTHIPGLDEGGWHDAGDDDLAAGSQASTTRVLALIHEQFGVDSDQTTVDTAGRVVRLHEPDGVPDLVQQVAHGARNLLSGYRAAGHSFAGLIVPTLEQYANLGEWGTQTDNRIHDARLGPNAIDGERSGRADDRLAFTNRDTALEYRVAAALAAASRALEELEPALARECLETAEGAWTHEHTHPPAEARGAYVPRDREAEELDAAVELLIATGAGRYRERIVEMLPLVEAKTERVGWLAARALPHVDDEGFTRGVRRALEAWRPKLETELGKNPFGVPWDPRVWGEGWKLQRFAVEQYYLVRAFPDLFDREVIPRVLSFVLGAHPGSSTSFVSGVGARSLTTAYGFNRADWSYIAGGNVSGVALIRPDFPELKEPWPFLWQQTEYVMPGAATYIFVVLAADELLSEAP
jgi:endoglucanase